MEEVYYDILGKLLQEGKLMQLRYELARINEADVADFLQRLDDPEQVAKSSAFCRRTCPPRSFLSWTPTPRRRS